jgi:mono/diheme cytochrome c family protein
LRQIRGECDPQPQERAALRRRISPTGAARAPAVETLLRGAYLFRVGDCVACHTNPVGQPFAGGLARPTPFGTLYSSNITPDAQWGIGTWTANDFYNMLHTGYARDGRTLYPAMPLPAYRKVTGADSDALFAYLGSLKPVHEPKHENELRFPYSNRSLLIGWRALHFP